MVFQYDMCYNVEKCQIGERDMAERNIKFQYFGVVRQKKIKNAWKGQGKLDINAWIDIVDKENMLMSVIELSDTKAQIEKINFYGQDNVWIFRFLKLREDNIPTIAKADEESEGILLGDDEYIGEYLYMLYDNETGIGMVQVNRFSLGLKRLEELLTYVWGTEGERIRLKAISEEFDLAKVQRRRKYRVLEVDFANLDAQLEDGHNSLTRIQNSFRTFHGVSGHVKISLGRTKKDTLNIDEVNQFVNDALEDNSVVGLKLKIKDDDNRPVETIDLFDNICNSIIKFNIVKKTVLDFDYAARTMIRYYNDLKVHLVDLITPHR